MFALKMTNIGDENLLAEVGKLMVARIGAYESIGAELYGPGQKECSCTAAHCHAAYHAFAAGRRAAYHRGVKCSLNQRGEFGRG